MHGGLRYLQQREFRLVYEALYERQRALENAPAPRARAAVPRPVLTRGGVIDRRLARVLGTALWMYDLTGGIRIGKRHHKISVDAALAHMPTLGARPHRRRLRVLRRPGRRRPAHAHHRPHRGRPTARRSPTTRAVRGIVKDGDRVVGARVEADGEEIVVRARAVVNAAGRLGRRRARARRRRAPGVDPAGEGHPHHRAVVEGAQRHRRHRAGARRPAVDLRRAVGRHAPTSAPPTPTTTARSTTRRARPPTSTTCSARSTASPTTSSPRPTSSAPGPGCGRSCARVARLAHRRPVAPALGPHRAERRGHRHRREAHDLPAHGRRRGRRGARRPRRAGTTLAHQAPAPVRRRGHGPAGRPRSTQRARAPRPAATGPTPSSCSRWSTTKPELGAPLVPGLPYLKAEARVRGHATRWPAPSTTSSAAARAPGCSRAMRPPRPPSEVAALLAPELGWSDATSATRRSPRTAASIADERGDGPASTRR